MSRRRRAYIADTALQAHTQSRLRNLTTDQIQHELMRLFPGELAAGEARMYAMGWTMRVVREGLRGLAADEGLDASGLGDTEVWRWLRGEVRPREWLPRLCKLFRCHQAQLGWPPQGNEPIVDCTTAGSSAQSERTDVNTLHYRKLLLGGAALAMPAITLDDLKHVVAALRNAPRYADHSVVQHFRTQMHDHTSSDGRLGPRVTLPRVLGMIAAIEETARHARPTIRRELLAVGAEVSEFAGWLYRDVGAPELAMYWRDRAIEWAQEAGDRPMQGYVLLKKSQAAWDERDALRMLTLSQAVQEGAWGLPFKVRAEAAQQEARAHAMMGANLDLVERKLDMAHELLATSPRPESGDELSAHYTYSTLAMQTALCYCQAGRPQRAVDVYSAELSRRSFSRRDFGYFTALKAQALVALGEPDEATRAGLMALEVAQATSSERTVHELAILAHDLHPWATRHGVCEFRQALLF